MRRLIDIADALACIALFVGFLAVAMFWRERRVGQ